MKTLTIPLSEDEIRNLKLGEIVYLTGEFYTARDEAHMTALEYVEEGKTLPVDFKDKAVFHCGPIMRKKNGEWELVAAGPTTSTRMNTLEPQFIEKFGPRAIIGKGGMGKETSKAFEKYGCVYLAITGGAAVLAAKGIKKVKGVEWFELGMPEALWILDGENFGPLIVAMDTHGNNLFENVEKEVEKNAVTVKKHLGLIK
ncbi:MAG: fumarate hydratase C-terminal domain-containing protein [Theionarchaea archaeon]|nr:fumarate hydratase C-terminal domain-containing protein [Theionarchaea archaeon]